MIDLLEPLYRPSSPVEPRPEFAAELRRHVEAEFRRESTTKVQTTITPMLSVRGPDEAIQFWKDAFGV